jgi:glutathione S-transferase
MFTGTFGAKMYLEKLDDAFSVLDKFLEGQNWVAGKNITIADYSIVATVASIEVRTAFYRLHARSAEWQLTTMHSRATCHVPQDGYLRTYMK